MIIKYLGSNSFDSFLQCRRYFWKIHFRFQSLLQLNILNNCSSVKVWILCNIYFDCQRSKMIYIYIVYIVHYRILVSFCQFIHLCCDEWIYNRWIHVNWSWKSKRTIIEGASWICLSFGINLWNNVWYFSGSPYVENNTEWLMTLN